MSKCYVCDICKKVLPELAGQQYFGTLGSIIFHKNTSCTVGGHSEPGVYYVEKHACDLCWDWLMKLIDGRSDPTCQPDEEVLK